MANMVEHDNNTIIIIHLPEDVSQNQLDAAKECDDFPSLEEGTELNETDKEKEKSILCAFCNRAFRHNSSLKRHLQLHDQSKAQSYECTICCKKLQYNSSLKRHMKLHSEEMKDKVYTCDICQKTFGYLTSLVRHRKLHSESEKEVYRCDLCNKTFVYSSSLKRHILLHTEGKTFECPTCNKYFGYATSLARHVRLHSSRQDFICLVCKKTLRSEKSYLKHMAGCQKKHGVIETIEIEQTSMEEGDDNFFSDTVKSEEISQSSDEEDQLDSLGVKSEGISDQHHEHENAKVRNQQMPSKSSEADIALADIAKSLEQTSNASEQVEAVNTGEHRVMEVDHETSVISYKNGDAIGQGKKPSFVKTDIVDNQPKTELNGGLYSASIDSDTGLEAINTSEGEVAKSLINIGMESIVHSASGRSQRVVITRNEACSLQSLVNAAVVESEQDLLARGNQVPAISTERETIINHAPMIGTANIDADLCSQPNSTNLADNSNLQSSDKGLISDVKEGDVNPAVSYPLTEGGVEDSDVSASKQEVVETTQHRLVATIDGKEVELQLASGANIIQYVVPTSVCNEQTFVIGASEASNVPNSFLVQAPTIGDNSTNLESVPAILEAVYISGGDIRAHMEGNEKDNPKKSAPLDISSETAVTES